MIGRAHSFRKGGWFLCARADVGTQFAHQILVPDHLHTKSVGGVENILCVLAVGRSFLFNDLLQELLRSGTAPTSKIRARACRDGRTATQTKPIAHDKSFVMVGTNGRYERNGASPPLVGSDSQNHLACDFFGPLSHLSLSLFLFPHRPLSHGLSSQKVLSQVYALSVLKPHSLHISACTCAVWSLFPNPLLFLWLRARVSSLPPSLSLPSFRSDLFWFFRHTRVSSCLPFTAAPFPACTDARSRELRPMLSHSHHACAGIATACVLDHSSEQRAHRYKSCAAMRQCGDGRHVKARPKAPRLTVTSTLRT